VIRTGVIFFKMWVNYKKKKNVLRKRVPRPGRALVAAASKTNLRQIVKREIARNVENKTAQQYSLNQNLYPSNSASFSYNTIELGINPNMTINQGVGSSGRIGNEIKTKKLTWKGIIAPLPYDATYNNLPTPVVLKLWIFYDKTDPTAIPAPLSNFFQYGGTNKGFSNDLVDTIFPENTDRYRILTTRTFKLGFANYEGSGLNAAAQAFANNDFKFNQEFSIDLTKYYPQRVRFDENVGTPTTRGLFAQFTVVRADGAAMNAAVIPCNFQFVQDYVYEDA